MRRAIALLALLVALSARPALAVEPDEMLGDPALEARARALSRELRCMVCQNESIDDSNAPLARDLRLLVRERLVTGDSDQAVLDFLVARYGDFVLLRPRLTAQTLLLWGAPFLVVLIGGTVMVLTLRRHRREASAPAPLTAEEEERVRKLIEP